MLKIVKNLDMSRSPHNKFLFQSTEYVEVLDPLWSRLPSHWYNKALLLYYSALLPTIFFPYTLLHFHRCLLLWTLSIFQRHSASSLGIGHRVQTLMVKVILFQNKQLSMVMQMGRKKRKQTCYWSLVEYYGTLGHTDKVVPLPFKQGKDKVALVFN
jgi:hypothetical protein